MANPTDPAKRPDLFILRGDSATINFTVDMDLTDCTVYFTAKSALGTESDDTLAAIQKTVTEHTDPTNGVTVIPLTATDTNVTPGTYYYDIQIKDGDGIVTSIPPRKMVISYDVTRRIS